MFSFCSVYIFLFRAIYSPPLLPRTNGMYNGVGSCSVIGESSLSDLYSCLRETASVAMPNNSTHTRLLAERLPSTCLT